MANWTNAALYVFVPKENEAAFLHAVKGPQEWRTPASAHGGFLSSSDGSEMTAHERMELIAERQRLEAEFRAHPYCQDYPDWMPFSIKDAQMTAAGEIEEIPECILSIPKLNPIVDRAEFDLIFPGKEVDGYWDLAIDQSKGVIQRIFSYGEHGLSYRKLGAHSILFEIDLVHKMSPRDDFSCLKFSFDVKNGVVEVFPQILPPVLKQFGAKALHVWAHNGETGGFDYVTPHPDDTVSKNETMADIAASIGLEQEDEDEYIYVDIPEILLFACQNIDDADFASID